MTSLVNLPESVIFKITSFLDREAVENLQLASEDLRCTIDLDVSLWRRLANSLEMRPFLANLTLHPSLYGMRQRDVAFWQKLINYYKATREHFIEGQSPRCSFVWQGCILYDQIFEIERGFVCGFPFTFSLSFGPQNRSFFLFSTKFFTVKVPMSSFVASAGKFTKCFISEFPVTDVMTQPMTLVVTSFPKSSHDAITLDCFTFTAQEIIKKQQLFFAMPLADAGVRRTMVSSQGNLFAVGTQQNTPIRISHVVIFILHSSNVQLLETLTFEDLSLQDLVFNVFDGSLLLKFWTEMEVWRMDPILGRFMRHRHVHFSNSCVFKSCMFAQTAIIYDSNLQSSVVLLSRRQEIHLWYIDVEKSQIVDSSVERGGIEEHAFKTDDGFIFSLFTNTTLRLLTQDQNFFENVIVEVLELDKVSTKDAKFRRQVAKRFIPSLRNMSKLVKSIYCEGLYCRGVLSSSVPGALQMSLSLHVGGLGENNEDMTEGELMAPHHHLSTIKKN